MSPPHSRHWIPTFFAVWFNRSPIFASKCIAGTPAVSQLSKELKTMHNACSAMALSFTPSDAPVLQHDSHPEVAPAQYSMEAVYQRFAPYVAAIASRILGRHSEVQDVVHDVFAAAVHGLLRRDDPNQIKRWLATVTVRRSTAQLRERALWQLFESASPEDYGALVEPTASSEDRSVIEEVYCALDKLPTRHRVAWVLRYIEGEQLEAVAELCGCSLATAKRRIAFAHEKILRQVKGRP